MSEVSVAQAIRNALEAERAAARFYERLRQNTNDPAAQAFLAQMARAEEAHARSIEDASTTLAATLPTDADALADAVETAPGWEWIEDLDLGEALQIALEAEHSAALFYEAVADALTGEARAFFEQLAATEGEHARALGEQARAWGLVTAS